MLTNMSHMYVCTSWWCLRIITSSYFVSVKAGSSHIHLCVCMCDGGLVCMHVWWWLESPWKLLCKKEDRKVLPGTWRYDLDVSWIQLYPNRRSSEMEFQALVVVVDCHGCTEHHEYTPLTFCREACNRPMWVSSAGVISVGRPARLSSSVHQCCCVAMRNSICQNDVVRKAYATRSTFVLCRSRIVLNVRIYAWSMARLRSKMCVCLHYFCQRDWLGTAYRWFIVLIWIDFLFSSLGTCDNCCYSA
jgi:hypothetical protein